MTHYRTETSTLAQKVFMYVIRLQTAIAITALALMVVINVAEIVSRFFFNFSLVWVQEVTLLLSCWAFFLGFSSISYYRKDIVILMFVQKLPGHLRRVAEFFAPFANAVFMLILAYSSFRLMLMQEGDSTMVVRIPTSLYTCSLLIASLSIFWVNWTDLIAMAKASLSRQAV